jgi:hypothetical protein
MHSDQGMFLVMTAAEYLDLDGSSSNGGKPSGQHGSGLLIQLPSGRLGDDGETVVVRPDFDPGSLLFMLGDGMRKWMRTAGSPVQIPAGTLHEVQVWTG